MASNSSSAEKIAIKRIHQDLKENSVNPIDGINVFIPDDDDIFNLHCDIQVLHGAYKDIKIHAT